jgi:molybdopterin synthase catalytic subunit
MTAKILFFSLLRDLVGSDQIDWEVPADGTTVAVLLDQLYAKWPNLREWDSKILVAVDLDYVDREARVAAGQEIAIMPPVQGG